MSAIPAFVFCLCFLLGQSSVGLAADFTGPVVSDLDGDTIEVLHNGQAEPIRLNGIDSHEKGHAYGKRAKQAGSKLVLGKEVTLKTFGRTSTGGPLLMYSSAIV